jgi:hypothetical protein
MLFYKNILQTNFTATLRWGRVIVIVVILFIVYCSELRHKSDNISLLPILP